ncbi:phenylacetate--CoA ligase family protein [Ramlibacter sp.]|uniref:phenylacetate--CoA ligase family protein n=1 Tax=Ramlibacter sp. TaxID=1917967 RepID=UPI003D0FAC99
MSANPPSFYYPHALDFDALLREFPTGREYVEQVHRMPVERLRDLQETRFLAQMKRAWEVPFYARHWGAAGMEPGDVRGLDDLDRIPPYDVNDLRESIERAPPWGDYLGIDPSTSPPMPLAFHTSGGTTGLPRPMLYTPRDREVMAITSARRQYLAGVRPFDIAQVTFSLGLANAGMLSREGLWKYTGAVPVVTGSGATLPTRRQIEVMRAWKVNVLLAFPAYLRHLADVARSEFGFDVRELGLKALVTHLGADAREPLESMWNAPAFDSYGTNECGTIASDCDLRGGMHVFEDAFAVQVCDAQTLKPTPEGERGTMFVTSLFKHAAPIIRFNSNDVSSWMRGTCACGGTHRRLERIFGRSDNMVKLRGVNVFPDAIGSVVAEQAWSNGEYVCLVETAQAHRDEMTVMVEDASGAAVRAGLQAALESRFKEVLGVKVLARIVDVGATDSLTGLSTTSKIRRLIDRRTPA